MDSDSGSSSDDDDSQKSSNSTSNSDDPETVAKSPLLMQKTFVGYGQSKKKTTKERKQDLYNSQIKKVILSHYAQSEANVDGKSKMFGYDLSQ